MIRVLIADDSVAIRDGLASLLNPKSGFHVVGLASDGLEAVENARELRSRGYQAYQANLP